MTDDQVLRATALSAAIETYNDTLADVIRTATEFYAFLKGDSK